MPLAYLKKKKKGFAVDTHRSQVDWDPIPLISFLFLLYQFPSYCITTLEKYNVKSLLPYYPDQNKYK